MNYILSDDKRVWKTFISSLDEKDFDIYHTYEFNNIYKKNSELLFFLYQQNKNYIFFPILKKKIENSDYFDFETPYGYGGPITNCSDDKNFLNLSFQKFKQLALKEKIIAGIIRFNPYIATSCINNIEDIKKIYSCKTVILNLIQNHDYERIFDNYSKDIKTRIKKNKNTYFFSNKFDSVKKFSEIYYKRMSDHNAEESYFFEKEYFENIALLNEDFWKIVEIHDNENIIGGAIILQNKKYCNIHLSSSLKEYFKFSPNIIIRDAIIKYCVENKIEILHFGGGRTNEFNDSLLNFKKKFSKELIDYNLGGFILNDKVYLDLCTNWKKKYLDSAEKKKFNNYFLKYRY